MRSPENITGMFVGSFISLCIKKANNLNKLVIKINVLKCEDL